MDAAAIHPRARTRAGMYESFYLRAVSPTDPVGVWIRNTVHKAPGAAPRGSVWCTVFDARSGAPFMHKHTTDELRVPSDGWIAVGQDTSMGPGRSHGSCGPARWSLSFTSAEPELRHLSPALLYRAPLPRTKLTSPAPAATFDGTLELEGRPAIELRGWRGMVGHNWGSEHAERWVWLHGIGFRDAPEAWLDVALGRLLIAGRMTPWVANGVLSLDGRRHRLGGLGARGLKVRESAQGAVLEIPGAHGLSLSARVDVPSGSAAGWRYADPDGSEHDVVNCSVAALELTVEQAVCAARTLRTEHGCAYELGMRERDHGVALAPFPDG
ncbi:MAG TPA: hypothetical protein VFY36_11570 [Solirubrobacteraceae bacterium]|nr:hypothetical protein [Solirubrobacteraceae bacterium]